MARVMITCPTTGAQAFTGIETDPASVNLIPPINTRLLCPNCGRIHVWSMLDAEIVPEPADGAEGSPSVRAARGSIRGH
jgi:hypothetical protein